MMAFILNYKLNNGKTKRERLNYQQVPNFPRPSTANNLTIQRFRGQNKSKF
jgi:hypothetical protein